MSGRLPNMALQRTRRPPLRSGRSLRSLGSPLNACSLGTRKWQLIGSSVAAVGLIILSSGCGACGNRVVAAVPSPSGRVEAVIFTRDCGATTAFSTQVSLLKPGSSLRNESGNLFVADTNHGAAAGSPDGGATVLVRWLSEESLEVSYEPGARVFKAESTHGGVRVQYVQRRSGA